jgi:tetratricopeptide (TPR) repeat protein
MTPYQTNLSILADRYPAIAAKLDDFRASNTVQVLQGPDGSPIHCVIKDGKPVPAMNPRNPAEVMASQMQQQSSGLSEATKPILLVGLNPGDELLYLYDLPARRKEDFQATQHIHVCIDSLACLEGFLTSYDASEVLSSSRVHLFLLDDVDAYSQEYHQHPEWPHYFTPISGSLNGSVPKTAEAFSKMIRMREDEYKRMIEENNDYYDALSDSDIANTILQAWPEEVTSHKCKVASESEQKTSKTSLESSSLSSVLRPPASNASLSSSQSNVYSLGSNVCDSPSPSPLSTVHCPPSTDSSSLLHAPCSLPSASPSSPQSMVYGLKSNVSGVRRRDLIIGYTGSLPQYGYPTERLQAMPMLVNDTYFHPRQLTPEQIEKYSCDLMFASRSGSDTSERVDELVADLQARDIEVNRQTLQLIHDHIWQKYRAGQSFTNYHVLQQEIIKILPYGNSLKQLLTAKRAPKQDLRLQTLDNRPNPSSSSPSTVHRPLSTDSSPSPLTSDLCPLTSAPSPSQSNVYGLKSNVCTRHAGAPRLLIPTSAWSTVNQYSARDIKEAFEKKGWDVQWVNVSQMITPYHMAKLINEFKPDVLMFVNHLRIEATDVYPKNLFFVTWLQDTVPYINRRDTADAWRRVIGFPPAQFDDIADKQDYAIQKIYWRLNDTIYRQLVIEWLDEYIQKHPHFKLHIYGEGWEKHPRFGRYHRGVLKHGEELSIAYQAAKYCLHLNSTEAGHQRLSEILSSGGRPITRSSNRDKLISEPLASAYRHWVAGQPIPAAADAAFNDEVFRIASDALNKEPDLTADMLQRRVQDALCTRIVTLPDWMISDWAQLNFSNRTDLAAILQAGKDHRLQTLDNRPNSESLCTDSSDPESKVYSLKSMVCDSPSPLSTVLCPPSSASSLSSVHCPPSSNASLSSSQSNVYSLGSNVCERAALASLNNHAFTIMLQNKVLELTGASDATCPILPLPEAAHPAIQFAEAIAAKATTEEIKVLLAGISSPGPEMVTLVVNRLIAEKKPEIAGKLLNFIPISSMTLQQKLIYLDYLEKAERFADILTLVPAIYTQDPNSKDILSRIAGQLNKGGKRAEALKLLHEDHKLGRQSSGWTVGLLSWSLDAKKTDEAKRVIAGISPDLLPSDSHRNTYAISLARLGRLDEAEQMMRDLYARNKDLKDGLTRIGWEYKATGNIPKTLELLDEDYSARRQSPAWTINYIAALLDAQKAKEAQSVISTIIFELLPNDSAQNVYYGALIHLGMLNEAEAVARKIYSNTKSSLRDGLGRIASELNKAGKRPRALKLLHEDNKVRRQSPGFALYLVSWLLDAQRPIEAESIISGMTIDDLPSDADRQHYSICLARLGRLMQAEILMRQLYARNKDLKDGLTRIGWEHKAQGNITKTMELLGEDYTSKRQSSAWTGTYITTLIDSDKKDVASCILSLLPFEDLSSETARSEFYASQVRLGMLDAAEATARKIYSNPNSRFRDGLSRIASELNKAGNRTKALELLKEDHTLERQTVAYTVYLVSWLLDAGRASEAEAILAAIPTDSPPNSSQRLIYATCLARLGRLREAALIIEGAYISDPYLKDGYARLAQAALMAGSLGDSLALYNKDISLNRLSPAARLTYATALAKDGKLDEALMHISSAYRLDTSLRDARLNLAKFLLLPTRQFAKAMKIAVIDHHEGRLSPKGEQIFEEIRRALQHQKNTRSKISYPLPAVLLSFPRSGSNFLQNVLAASSSLHSQSIYGHMPEDTAHVLTLKSHSPSMQHFTDEWSALTKIKKLPRKAIILIRDPRDIMVSFREFAEAKRCITISQEDFLDGTDYFFAAGPQRRVHQDPLSIADAYTEFVNTWIEHRNDLPFLNMIVRYEDLVSSPEETFSRLFDFLELDCKLATPSLEQRVALYSKSSARPRGRASGWCNLRESQSVIISATESKLCREIQLLGYPLVGHAETSREIVQ